MIDKFDGTEYRFLSNFYLHPIVWEELRYPSTEHAYQAAKTLNPMIRKQMAAERSPGQVKKLGRAVKLRPDWEQVKVQVMLEVLQLKFEDEALAQRLMDTHPHQLVEGNTWGDKFWGVCDGEGRNFLGKSLMLIRANLIADHLMCEVLPIVTELHAYGAK